MMISATDPDKTNQSEKKKIKIVNNLKRQSIDNEVVLTMIKISKRIISKLKEILEHFKERQRRRDIEVLKPL